MWVKAVSFFRKAHTRDSVKQSVQLVLCSIYLCKPLFVSSLRGVHIQYSVHMIISESGFTNGRSALGASCGPVLEQRRWSSQQGLKDPHRCERERECMYRSCCGNPSKDSLLWWQPVFVLHNTQPSRQLQSHPAECTHALRELWGGRKEEEGVKTMVAAAEAWAPAGVK